MTRTRTRMMVGCTAAVALTLSACGSSSSDDAAEETDTSETTEVTPTTKAEATETTETSAEGESDGEEMAAEPLRVGFLPPSLEIPAFQGLWHGLEGYGGGRYGDEVVAVDAKFDPTVQVQTLQQWTELGQVDAIWIIPVAGQAVATALEDAIAAGIPIVASGVPADYGWDGAMPGITFANIDSAAFGGGIGDMMAACVNDRLGGEAEVLYIGPADPAESTALINDNSQAALAEGAPGANIVQVLIAATDVASTQQLLESALQANPGVTAVMAGDAEATMSGLNVLTAAGNEATEVCVVGNGGEEDQLASIEAGELFGTVAFDFEADLMQNVDELHRLAAEPGSDGQLLTIPINIIGG